MQQMSSHFVSLRQRIESSSFFSFFLSFFLSFFFFFSLFVYFRSIHGSSSLASSFFSFFPLPIPAHSSLLYHLYHLYHLCRTRKEKVDFISQLRNQSCCLYIIVQSHITPLIHSMQSYSLSHSLQVCACYRVQNDRNNMCIQQLTWQSAWEESRQMLVQSDSVDET